MCLTFLFLPTAFPGERPDETDGLYLVGGATNERPRGAQLFSFSQIFHLAVVTDACTDSCTHSEYIAKQSYRTVTENRKETHHTDRITTHECNTRNNATHNNALKNKYCKRKLIQQKQPTTHSENSVTVSVPAVCV